MNYIKPYCQTDETENSLIVYADIPGVKKDDVGIQVYEDEITLIAKNKNRAYSASFYFDSYILDKNQIKAALSEGVLKVEIKKKSSSLPATVKVE